MHMNLVNFPEFECGIPEVGLVLNATIDDLSCTDSAIFNPVMNLNARQSDSSGI
jgi:hypothetical protein